jgi:hypothetical protein
MVEKSREKVKIFLATSFTGNKIMSEFFLYLPFVFSKLFKQYIRAALKTRLLNRALYRVGNTLTLRFQSQFSQNNLRTEK